MENQLRGGDKMYLFCSSCQYYVIAQKFKRFFDKEKKDFKEEYYCPECLGTIFIKEKESKLEE